jgi:hypothetical protein
VRSLTWSWLLSGNQPPHLPQSRRSSIGGRPRRNRIERRLRTVKRCTTQEGAGDDAQTRCKEWATRRIGGSRQGPWELSTQSPPQQTAAWRRSARYRRAISHHRKTRQARRRGAPSPSQSCWCTLRMGHSERRPLTGQLRAPTLRTSTYSILRPAAAPVSAYR